MDKLSSHEKTKTTTKPQSNWVVNKVSNITQGINKDSLTILRRQFIEPDKNLEKNYFIEDKKTSKKDFYTQFKNNKDYHFGSVYTNKEKSIINMYISKSQNKIIKLLRKGY